MMRKIIFVSALISASACSATAQQYCYVQGGEIKSQPRELPSVGVRQDNGQAVVGLHGAEDNIKRACGWYAVQDALQAAPADSVVTGVTYSLDSTVVLREWQYGTVQTVTLAERARALFDQPELQAFSDEEKAAKIIKAVADAVTNKLATAMEIIIPVTPQGGGG